MAESEKLLVVKSAVSEFIKGKSEEMTGEKYKVAGDLADALSDKVKALLVDAIERCKANKRKTIDPRDL